MRTLCARPAGRFYDLPGITGKVTDGWIYLPERNLHVFSLNRQRDRRHRASSHVIAVIGRPSCKRGILRLGVLAPRVFLLPRYDVSSGMLKPMTAMSRDHGDDGDFSTGAVSVVL